MPISPKATPVLKLKKNGLMLPASAEPGNPQMNEFNTPNDKLSLRTSLGNTIHNTN